MTRIFALAVFAAVIVVAPVAHASDTGSRAAHFQARHSETVEDAAANLRDATAKLAELLAGDVSDQDMNDIHNLSYTLEDTLKRLSDELRLLHDTVADMHWASEGLNRAAVVDYGEAYLDGIRKILD